MSVGNAQTGEANPRAFVTATGFVFQVLGFVLAGGGCLLWSISGFLEDELDQPINVVSDYVRRGVLSKTIALVCIVTTSIAGLGLIATGLGLQGERRGSGLWALAVTGILALVWWGSMVGFVWVSAVYWKIIVAAFFAGISTVLFLLAGNSSRILKLYPPPDDLSVVSDEFLEEYSRKGSE